METNNSTSVRSISDIALEIFAKWKNPYFGAVPYLSAMRTLQSINSDYGADSASDIINYFLSNASTWRGEDAKRIKTELKSLLKQK